MLHRIISDRRCVPRSGSHHHQRSRQPHANCATVPPMKISLTFEIPDDLGEYLTAPGVNLAQIARDGLAIECYRRNLTGASGVAYIVDLPSTCDALYWLTDHEVPSNWTVEDVDAEFRAGDALERLEQLERQGLPKGRKHDS